VFLRKIIPGGADRSYGIDVASLAGVPKPVIDRAKVIAAELSDADITAKAKNIKTSESFTQEAFDEEGFLKDRDEEKPAADIKNTAEKEAVYGADISEAVEFLKSLDVNHMTPLDAMNTLYELKSKFGV
jgi:DNA mismatch repair protein MutS